MSRRTYPRTVIALAFAGLVIAVPSYPQSPTFIEAEFDGIVGVSGLDGARAVAVSPDGKHLYAAAESDGAVTAWRRFSSTGELTFIEAEIDGVNGVDGLAQAEHLALSPGGENLYAVGLFDGLAVFSRSSMSGELTFLEVHKDNTAGVNGLAGASWVDVSPDGKHVYVAGRGDDGLAVFSRNLANGQLTFVTAVLDGAGGVDGLAEVTSVVVSPDGAHLYAAGLGDQKVAVFERSSATGLLTFAQAVNDGLAKGDVDVDDHLSLGISPDGAHLYVANHVEALAEGWISIFARDAGSGMLSAVTPGLSADAVDFCFIGIEGDSTVAVSPDGNRVYANLTFDSALVSLERDPATGRLTVLGGICDESIGMGMDPAMVDGLFACQGVAISADGESVYVASTNLEDAVAVIFTGIFADGFESGDTSRWSTTLTP